LVRDKHAGKEVVAEAEPPEATEVVDLMDALRRSVEGSRGKRAQGRASKGSQSGAGKRSKSSRNEQADLSELTKGDLDRKARELGIEGRSKMKRSELEKAVRKAS
jgi:DNA end-binding protein Ku